MNGLPMETTSYLHILMSFPDLFPLFPPSPRLLFLTIFPFRSFIFPFNQTNFYSITLHQNPFIKTPFLLLFFLTVTIFFVWNLIFPYEVISEEMIICNLNNNITFYIDFTLLEFFRWKLILRNFENFKKHCYCQQGCNFLWHTALGLRHCKLLKPLSLLYNVFK